VHAASAASLPAGWVLRIQGRRLSILLGCAAYCIAFLLQGAAVNMRMLLAGQVMHGVAAAFLYQVRCALQQHHRSSEIVKL
jgi:MFS family permease